MRVPRCLCFELNARRRSVATDSLPSRAAPGSSEAVLCGLAAVKLSDTTWPIPKDNSDDLGHGSLLVAVADPKSLIALDSPVLMADEMLCMTQLVLDG